MHSRGLTQAQLARSVGVADTQISRWRRGQVVPTLQYLQRLADTFGIDRMTLDQLVGLPVAQAPGGEPGVEPEVEAELQAHQARLRAVMQTRLPRSMWQAYVEACVALAEGLSTSVRTGIGALSTNVDSAIVQLGDMPGVNAGLLDRLMAAYNPVEGRAICVPTVVGKRGNPVLWARRFFPEMARLAGDTGAKHLIGEHADLVCEVEMAGEAAVTDIDTPEALAAWRTRSSE